MLLSFIIILLHVRVKEQNIWLYYDITKHFFQAIVSGRLQETQKGCGKLERKEEKKINIIKYTAFFVIIVMKNHVS